MPGSESESDKGSLGGKDCLEGDVDRFLSAGLSYEEVIVVGAMVNPSEFSLEDVGDAEGDCLRHIDVSVDCICVMDKSTSERWLMAPEAFRRFGIGPDIADGDTCLEKLRGVRVAEVLCDGFCDGVETPVLMELGACLKCWRDTDVAERWGLEESKPKLPTGSSVVE